MRTQHAETMVARRAGIGPRSRTILLIALNAIVLGTLEIWSNIGGGYSAGWGDHFVLSPQGLSWAIPGAFQNDWFMDAAPQPHWFFDALTFAGESLGVLSLFYALFWFAGVGSFAAATVLLAGRFAPGARGVVSVAVTAVAAITPWMVGGTGSPVIAQALPAVLSANMIYLLIAALLSGHRIVVALVGPLVALVHVQQGAIALVLLVSVLIVDAVRRRRLDGPLAVAAAATAALVVFGLVLRPVASNPADFVEICDTIIPYHCASHLWGRKDLLATVGFVTLTVLSVVLVSRAARWKWLATVGLATLGFTGGFVADALRVPYLGELAQSVNVYRLGAVLLPFALWGLFVPFLTRLRGVRRTVVLVAWAFGWATFLLAGGWWATTTAARLVVFAIALGTPLVWYVWRTRGATAVHHRASAAAAAAAALLVLGGVTLTGGLTARVPVFDVVGDPNLRAWGAEVRAVVPSGDIVIASPRQEWVKLVTQRAVVVDCKDVPYGGPAWDEWQRRLELFGGQEQCVAPGPLRYNDLSARDLISLADEFASDFIAIDAAEPDTVVQLQDAGWILEVQPIAGSGAYLLARPL